MWHVKTVTFLVLTSLSAHGAIRPGDYLFLHAQILGCGDETYIVDYSEVPKDGNIMVLKGIEISVLGLNEEEIALLLANKIEAQTGHKPETLSVQLVPAADSERIARDIKAYLDFQPCDRLRDSPFPPHKDQRDPPSAEGYNRRLASAPPNKSSMDSSVKS